MNGLYAETKFPSERNAVSKIQKNGQNYHTEKISNLLADLAKLCFFTVYDPALDIFIIIYIGAIEIRLVLCSLHKKNQAVCQAEKRKSTSVSETCPMAFITSCLLLLASGSRMVILVKCVIR